MTEADASAIKEQLLALAKMPDNAECADCKEKDPQWASANLGVFICIVCAGIHRNLGVHVSRVKSIMLDTWKPEDVEIMRQIGNKKSNETYEGDLRHHRPIRAATDSVALREQWIRAKYVRKLYQKDSASPHPLEFPSREGFMTKKGEVVKNWKRRWFKLQGSILLYYKKQQDNMPAGCVCLTETTRLPDCLVEPLPNQAYCFTVCIPSREYYMNADSGEDMYDWIQAIRFAKSYLSDPKSYSNNNKASDITNGQVENLIPELTKLASQKRKLNGKIYSNCLQGAQVVDYLVHAFKLTSRSEACLIAQQLLDKGIMRSLTSEPFSDGATIYTFLPSYANEVSPR